MSTLETRSPDLAENERYPIADEFFKQETIEAVLGYHRQARQARRRGHLPYFTVFDLDYPIDVAKDMEPGYRQRLINYQHELFMSALRDRRVQPQIMEPVALEARWLSQDNEPLRTTFIRLNRDLALTETTYLGPKEAPYRYRPMIWVGKHGLNDFADAHLDG